MAACENATTKGCSRLYAPKIHHAMPQSGAPLWICVEEEENIDTAELMSIDEKVYGPSSFCHFPARKRAPRASNWQNAEGRAAGQQQ